ncbi:hypothetical protein VTN00DRAFT_1284 [Thermoascus crustaceus]|uniref:uncharacterized protein n=1 Tax=Thermoascus crustaceus TaxID=5088 RepID=UPI003743ED0F
MWSVSLRRMDGGCVTLATPVTTIGGRIASDRVSGVARGQVCGCSDSEKGGVLSDKRRYHSTVRNSGRCCAMRGCWPVDLPTQMSHTNPFRRTSTERDRGYQYWVNGKSFARKEPGEEAVPGVYLPAVPVRPRRTVPGIGLAGLKNKGSWAFQQRAKGAGQRTSTLAGAARPCVRAAFYVVEEIGESLRHVPEAWTRDLDPIITDSVS